MLKNSTRYRDTNKRTQIPTTFEIVAAMPTLVWRVRPKSGTGAAAREGSGTSSRAAPAVRPDPVVSASAAAKAAFPDSVVPAVSAVPGASTGTVQAALSAECRERKKRKRDKSCKNNQALQSASSTTRYSGDGRNQKRKVHRAESARTGKKKSKTTSNQGLRKVVRKNTSSRKFESNIKWGGKARYIGAFDTAEQASAAYLSIKKDLDNAKFSAIGGDATFNAAKKKAIESVGGSIPTTKRSTAMRDLPRGVYKTRAGKFVSQITCCGKTNRYIGFFNTPEQASAAYLSVSEDISQVSLSGLGADEADAIFDAAREKAVERIRSKKK